MMASMEYLLCGVPVVTTPNQGGRNYFFRSEYSIMANPSLESVTEAVDFLSRRNLDTEYVRGKVLEIVHRERAIFFHEASSWLAKEGAKLDFEAAFHARYINRMWETFETPDDFLARNNGCR